MTIRRILLSGVCGCLAAVSPLCGWQQPQPSESPAPPVSASGTGGTTSLTSTPKPPDEPYVLEDGGVSIEPIYWLNRAQPSLSGGAAATSYGSLDYPGKANYILGGEIGIPAGHSNTLRISYFHAQGNGNSTLSQPSTIFSEGYAAGDYLNANYLVQSAKISWDYLSYTWHKAPGAIRLKTLWELQFLNAGTNVIAPFKAITADASSGTTDDNTAHGSKNMFLPTFGLEAEQKFGRYFRWEVKASGFGLPHRGDIWDGEGSLAFRWRQFELLGGEKGFHFKTSPLGAEYFTSTMSGAYVGLRYYWNTEH